MPYDFNWQDDAHTIIRMDIHGEVSWDAYYKAIDQVIAELEKSPQRIDLIFNDSVGMPKGNPMPHLKMTTAKLASYPNMGLVYTVSEGKTSSIVKMMLDIVMRAYRMDTSHYGGFVDSMDNALSAIAKDRATRAQVA